MLDFSRLLALEFRPIDEARFPMLRIAREVMHAGGTAPAIYNAANEVAVAAFLGGRLPFVGIPRVVAQTLAQLPSIEPADLACVLAVDSEARRIAEAQF